MVKIKNQFGDIKRGKQHTVVYQGHYGDQTRRMLKEHKDEHTRGQLEQRERFKVGIDFAKGLTKAQKDFIKSYMAEADIRSPDGLPTTWYSFSKKIAMTRPKVDIEIEEETGGIGLYGEWPYYSQITTNNTTGGALTNKQALIILTTDNIDYSHFKADGFDIRFTNINDVALSFWVQEWNNGGTSLVWVKVDSIPTGENICCNLHHGNSNASDASDGDATFEFFEDFNEGSLNTDKWFQDTTIAPTFADGVITVKGQSGSYINGIRGKTTFDTENYIFAAKITAAQEYAHSGWADSGIGSSPLNWINFRLSTQKQYSIMKASSSASANMAWAYNKRLEAWRSGSTAYFYEDGVELTNINDAAHVPTIDLSPCLLATSGGFIKADWVFVRKRATPEPTNSVGSELLTGTGNKLTSLKIHHPAIKSYEIIKIETVMKKEDNLSNLENHITTVITQSDLNLVATKIKVKTLANQEYEYHIT